MVHLLPHFGYAGIASAIGNVIIGAGSMVVAEVVQDWRIAVAGIVATVVTTGLQLLAAHLRMRARRSRRNSAARNQPTQKVARQRRK